jgi:hypothetical protein
VLEVGRSQRTQLKRVGVKDEDPTRERVAQRPVAGRGQRRRGLAQLGVGAERLLHRRAHPVRKRRQRVGQHAHRRVAPGQRELVVRELAVGVRGELGHRAEPHRVVELVEGELLLRGRRRHRRRALGGQRRAGGHGLDVAHCIGGVSEGAYSDDLTTLRIGRDSGRNPRYNSQLFPSL